MPTTLPPKLALGAVFKREDPRDALVLKPSSLPSNTSPSEPLTAHTILSSLPAGSIIGTSSLRRAAQLRRKFPHLDFKDVRGNVPTRLKKLDAPDSFADQEVPNYAALVLAAAGLIRLDLGHRITAHLSGKDGGVLHAVGQGALGVEVREGDERILGMLEKLGDLKSELACWAERSIMRTLEGGCSVPIGVETEWSSEDEDQLIVRAAVVSLDGKEAGEVEEKAVIKTREEANEFGKTIAKLLVERGAGKILDDVNAHRKADAEKTVS
jgi:hydroxymethylbilane synthase